MHRGTDASKENKCKELLHGRGKEDEARHLGMGCWFSVLRPVLCFGTDPSPFCGGGGRGRGAVVAANRWPHPGAGSARTDEPLPVPREDPNPTLPLSHVNFPSASHLLPALVPGPALGLVSVAAL